MQNSIRPTPLYKCFQSANFDKPHGHHEFCMQFWPTQTDSHAVSHFKELCPPILFWVPQVDLLCESCQQFLSRLDQADYVAPSLNLNLRLVSLCFPERLPSTQDYLEFFTTIRGVKNLTHLKLTDFPPERVGQLTEMSNTLENLNKIHLIID